MTMEHNFTVREKEAGERLDRWLCSKMPQFSRGQIKDLLDGGRVLINNRRVVIAGWEVEQGDEVEVRLPPGFGGAGRAHEREEPSHERGAPASRPAHEEHGGARAGHAVIRASIERHFERQKDRRRPEPEQQKRERPGRGEKHRRLGIYHEDRDIIVVEKPAGILAVPSEGKGHGGTSLLAEVEAYLKRKYPEGKGSFVAPLHRLDAETSGVMVFALSNNGKKLENQFRDHSVRREYTAVVAGRVEQEQGVIDMPLEKGSFHGGKKVRHARHGGGKRAVTEFRVKERYAKAALLEVRVRTGRTHQIRVHLAEKGFPLIGDKLYSEKGEGAPVTSAEGGSASGGKPSALHKGVGGQAGKHDFSRHALHAHIVGFRHPVTGRKYTFHSPLPDDMKRLIDELRERQS